MTMPLGSTEEPDVTEIEHQSVAVRVISSDAKPGKSIAPEFGRYRTFLVTSALGNDLAVPGARRIANRSLRRHRIHIVVNGSGSVTGQTTITGANPAAGAAFVYTNNTGLPQQLLFATAHFNSDAVVANRFLQFLIATQSGQQIAYGQNTAAVVASSSISFNIGQGYNIENSASGNAFFPLPTGIVIPPLGTLTFSASGMDAGDTWTSIFLTFAAVAQSVTDGVIVGGREEIAALQNSNNPITTYTPGGYLQIGDSIRYESQQELWVAYPPSNTAPVIVTTCDEVYASDIKRE